MKMPSLIMFCIFFSLPIGGVAMPIVYELTGSVDSIEILPPSGGVLRHPPEAPLFDGPETIFNGDPSATGLIALDLATIPQDTLINGTSPGGVLYWSLSTLGQEFERRNGGTIQHIDIGETTFGYVDEIPWSSLFFPDLVAFDLQFTADPFISDLLAGTFTIAWIYEQLSDGTTIGLVSGNFSGVRRVPEPNALLILLFGLAALIVLRNRLIIERPLSP